MKSVYRLPKCLCRVSNLAELILWVRIPHSLLIGTENLGTKKWREALTGARATPFKKQTPHFGLWCNGNTSDFGSEIRGSNPRGPTKHSRYEKNNWIQRNATGQMPKSSRLCA